MDGHDAHAVRPVLDDRGLALLGAFGIGLELLDERAERGDPLTLGAPRQIQEAADVRQRLLSRRPDREAGMRAHGGEEASDRIGERPSISLPVQVAQQGERLGDGQQRRRRLLGQRTEGMQRAIAVAPGEQRAVVERQERPAQRGEQRELVLGTLDRQQHVAQGLDLLARVERAAADQDVPQVARLERAHVRTRHVLAPRSHATEEQADVPALHRHRLVVTRRIGHPPAAVGHHPLDEGGHGIGQRALDLEVDGPPEPPERLRHRQGDHRGLAGERAAERRQRDVRGLGRRRPPRHRRGEGRIHGVLDRRHGAEADREMYHRRPGADELALDALVQPDVGAPEAIDRLLRIAHQEELAGYGSDAAPVPFGRIAGGEQEQQLGLERIGVLELVDEEMAPARLQAAAHARVVAHQVACPQQQIDEVETAGATLQPLVVLDQRPQVVAQQRCQLGARAAHEVVELALRAQRAARGERPGRDRDRA